MLDNQIVKLHREVGGSKSKLEWLIDNYMEQRDKYLRGEVDVEKGLMELNGYKRSIKEEYNKNKEQVN